MAYGLKYYAEIQNFRKQLARVEIYQRDYSSTVLEIGDVCGLALEVQGGMEDIFTPIVKTQARLSMISSDDKPTSGGVKYGGWGEFFTPDDTLYKFVILTKATPSTANWTTRWSGYITPDSWQEGLEYRSAVTITARDNIGHLQDFEFDMAGDSYGLAKIKDILDGAMAKISMPMSVSYNYGVDLRADGERITDSYIVVSKFQGKDWYSALESILDAIGYTLRYTDSNRVTFAPLRHLPLLGESSEANQPSINSLEFFGGNGEQVPAVKSITEEHDYDYNGEVFLPILGTITYGSNQTYRCYVNGDTWKRQEHDATYNDVYSAGNTIWDAGSDLLNIAGKDQVRYLDGSGVFRDEGDRWNQYAFLAANGTDTSLRSQAMHFFCGSSDVTIKAVFAGVPAGLTQSGTQVTRWNAALYKIKYSLYITDGTTTKHWSGRDWVDSQTTIEKEYDYKNEFNTDLEIALMPCASFPDGGVIHLAFEGIWYMMNYTSGTPYGLYARLASVSATPNVTNLAKNTVRTINDEKYNVRLERSTEVSPLSRDCVVALPSNYPTALFYYPDSGSYPAPFPYMMNWDNLSTNVLKPLPVFVHQQILCYRGTNLWELSGDCAPENGGMFWFNGQLHYKSRTYLLLSGTIDFMSGTIQGAVLREFLEYDDIWDDTVQPDPGDPGSWEDATSYPGSGAASTSSSAGSSLAPAGGINYFEEDGEGNIKLKDDYNGLWAAGFITAGGVGEESGGGGIDLDRVWESLTNNTDKPDVKINAAHIPIASTNAVGGIKVGSGLSIAQDGTLSATGGATGTVSGIRVGSGGSTLSPDSGGVVTIPDYGISNGTITINGTSITPLTAVPKATSSVIGGFQTGFTESGQYYAVNMSGNKAYVYVPWTDNNTTYKLKVNGSWNGDSTSGTSLGTVYAPTTAGTQGYGLIANSNGVPAWTDLSGIYLPLDGGTLTGDLRLKGSTNYGLTLRFGNLSYAYISNDSNRHLAIYAQYGISLSTGSDSYPITFGNAATFNGGLTIDSAKTLTLGTGVLKWDSTNSAWHLEGNFYADGFITAGGIGSTNTQLVTLEGTQTISGAKTFSAATTFSRIGVGTAPNSSYAIYASGSQYLSGGLSVGSSATITSGLGVGTAWTGGANKLVVSGSAIATAWNTSSDRRLKDNIKLITKDEALAKLMALKPSTWNWKENGKAGSGFVAQDVMEIIPSAVHGEDILGIDYAQFHPFEVAVIQGLVREIDELKRRLGYVAQ